MKIMTKVWVGLLLAGIAFGTVPARAQEEDPAHPEKEKGAPPFKEAPGALGYLQRASYSLGMLRRVGGSTHAVTGIMFNANGTMSDAGPGGTWTEYKVPKVTVEMTYNNFHQGVVQSPGARWDYSLVGSNGQTQRKIFAAAGTAAWDEATPGGAASPAMNAAAYRLTLNFLTPHGLLWEALTADGKGISEGVKMTQEGGKTILMIPVNGVPAKVTMGDDHRPEKVETRIKHPILGDTPVEITYSNYKDIEIGYGIYFPEHVVEKLGGHTVLDLTVTEFHTNPYSVFPVPANVQQAAK
jgi:hypothetical protein